MKKYVLGKSDLYVPKLCFGGNVFGWTLDERASMRMLDALYDNDLTFIDTANNYSHWVQGNSGGESEAILGKWFRESKKRHDIVLSTKVGGSMQGVERSLSRQAIIQGVDASLMRLRTDYIDLYFSHHDDLDTPIEETMEAFNHLLKVGKVRYLGASNLSADRIERSNAIARTKGWAEYIALQPLYNLYDRSKYEQEYQPLVDKEKLAVMSYFALASGFLSGKYDSIEDTYGIAREEMLKDYFSERGTRILNAIKVVAQRHNVTCSEVAIAWQLFQEYRIIPIVSATTQQQLNSLLNSINLPLTTEDMLLLNSASEL
ncbi:aldo/keto reductase [Myroides pelagicus]|uniref:aldo/keto reductase n=1 Tax=Myroides pelagicus TaxID=270914 RepID=UPI002DB6139C|nr:aldo/keto reductase [Myroides pelagicus]MEC4112927.1 aldo/keto reductase [Myroides pelagicus]